MWFRNNLMMAQIVKNGSKSWVKTFVLTFISKPVYPKSLPLSLFRRWSKSFSGKRHLALAAPLVFASMLGKSQGDDIKKAIDESEEFYKTRKFFECYDTLIPFKDTDDVEVLWRLARALYNITDAPMSTEEKTKYIEEALVYVDKALALNDKSPAVHKWRAIIIDVKTILEGTKARIQCMPVFENHVKRAIELDPEDATSLYMLGVYYFSISELPWYQKKLVTTLYGSVPPASFEDALVYFNKAEEARPNFYSKNLLMLGKTYLKLGMKDSAKHWLQRAADAVAVSEEDKKVKKEAGDLLKNMN